MYIIKIPKGKSSLCYLQSIGLEFGFLGILSNLVPGKSLVLVTNTNFKESCTFIYLFSVNDLSSFLQPYGARFFS